LVDDLDPILLTEDYLVPFLFIFVFLQILIEQNGFASLGGTSLFFVQSTGL
jgi:hypothetical protein